MKYLDVMCALKLDYNIDAKVGIRKGQLFQIIVI